MDLTDEDIWTLICAPPFTSSRDLAITRGLPVTQVMRVHLHYRGESWACPVDYVSCTICGELIIVGQAMGSITDHAWCHPVPGVAIPAIQADRKRYLPEVPSHPSTVGRRKYIVWTKEEDVELITRVGSDPCTPLGACWIALRTACGDAGTNSASKHGSTEASMIVLQSMTTMPRSQSTYETRLPAWRARSPDAGPCTACHRGHRMPEATGIP